MADDREPTRRFTDEERLRNSPATRDAAHVERFTDEEAAVLRRLRFGTLPGQVPPADWVEGVAAESPPEEPEPPPEHMHLG